MSQNKVTKLSFWFSLSQRRVLLSTWLGKSENSGIGPQISLSLFTRHHPAVSNKACDSSLPNLSWNHVLSPSLATLSPQSVTDSPRTAAFILQSVPTLQWVWGKHNEGSVSWHLLLNPSKPHCLLPGAQLRWLPPSLHGLARRPCS